MKESRLRENSSDLVRGQRSCLKGCPNSALTVNRFLADFGFEAFTFNSSHNPPLCPFDPGASLPQYFDLLFVRSESVKGGRDA